MMKLAKHFQDFALPTNKLIFFKLVWCNLGHYKTVHGHAVRVPQSHSSSSSSSIDTGNNNNLGIWVANICANDTTPVS
jgi:hypothetical protein